MQGRRKYRSKRPKAHTKVPEATSSGRRYRHGRRHAAWHSLRCVNTNTLGTCSPSRRTSRRSRQRHLRVHWCHQAHTHRTLGSACRLQYVERCWRRWLIYTRRRGLEHSRRSRWRVPTWVTRVCRPPSMVTVLVPVTSRTTMCGGRRPSRVTLGGAMRGRVPIRVRIGEDARRQWRHVRNLTWAAMPASMIGSSARSRPR